MRQKRVTISDVAKVAGVSKQTVSRVINDRPDVADETRRYIKDVILKLGYQPDPIAQSMKGITQTLGCITPNLSDFSFSSIIQAAQAEALKKGFFILTGSAQSEFDVPPLLKQILNRRVDGLLVINPRDDGRNRHFLSLAEQNFPMVYLKNSPMGDPVSAVYLDDKLGGYLATKHLIELGHSEIVIIQGNRNEECTNERFAGYLDAFAEAGRATNPSLITQGDWSAVSGKLAVQNLLERKINFSAVFAQNDLMAVGAISALREADLHVPQDISVVGFDDIPLSSFFAPPLTTIRQPMSKFGQIGAQLLIDAIRKPDSSRQTIVLKPELIIRNSCNLHPNHN